MIKEEQVEGMDPINTLALRVKINAGPRYCSETYLEQLWVYQATLDSDSDSFSHDACFCDDSLDCLHHHLGCMCVDHDTSLVSCICRWPLLMMRRIVMRSVCEPGNVKERVRFGEDDSHTD